MTTRELASLPAKEVRNNENLMRLYISEYKGVFGYEPNCAGCTFDNDWSKFRKVILYGEAPQINYSQLKYQQTMATFKLKRQFLGDILWYRPKSGKGVNRTYGRHMTEEFAKDYLTHGTEKEIEERKGKFDKLPESVSTDSKEAGNGSISEKTEVSSNDEKTMSNVENDDAPKPKSTRKKKSTKKK